VHVDASAFDSDDFERSIADHEEASGHNSAVDFRSRPVNRTREPNPSADLWHSRRALEMLEEAYDCGPDVLTDLVHAEIISKMDIGVSSELR